MFGKMVVEEDEITYSTQHSVQTADASGWDICRKVITHPNRMRQLLSTQTSTVSSTFSELNPKKLRACNSYVKTRKSQNTTIIRNIALILMFCALISVLVGIGITLYYRIIGDNNIPRPKEKQGALNSS
jgi:hypothetical protein